MWLFKGRRGFIKLDEGQDDQARPERHEESKQQTEARANSSRADFKVLDKEVNTLKRDVADYLEGASNLTDTDLRNKVTLVQKKLKDIIAEAPMRRAHYVNLLELGKTESIIQRIEATAARLLKELEQGPIHGRVRAETCDSGEGHSDDGVDGVSGGSDIYLDDMPSVSRWIDDELEKLRPSITLGRPDKTITTFDLVSKARPSLHRSLSTDDLNASTWPPRTEILSLPSRVQGTRLSKGNEREFL